MSKPVRTTPKGAMVYISQKELAAIEDATEQIGGIIETVGVENREYWHDFHETLDGLARKCQRRLPYVYNRTRLLAGE
jgi:hypothetical protein